MRNKNQKKSAKKSKIKLIILKTILILFILGVIAGYTILYGPWHGFRDWLITTSMTTLSHQWMATSFYSPKTIESVLADNAVIETGETTNADEVEIKEVVEEEVYENEYEEQILKKEPGNDLYKVIEITGKGYTGHLVAIYDPSTISVCTTKYLNSKGQYLVDMAKDNNAVVAINGGGFIDPDYNSLGGVPQGVVISKGKIVSSRKYKAVGGVIRI